jgi:hypothetical protein
VSDWFDVGGDGSACDVSALLSDNCIPVLVRCLEAGALVSLGVSRDGGALGATVTLDGRWRREWHREESELVTFLLGAATALETPSASSGQRNGTAPQSTRRRRSSAR